jgi:hypothetical protein
MDETTKRAIKKTILALRKLLERQDIPSVLRQYGIFPDGRRIPIDKLALLDENGKKRRERLEAIIDREVQAVGGEQKAGVERYCREVAFTYLNRLIALRSMEARGLLDECIKIREDYAGRSLRHHRFLKENPGIQFDAEDTDSFKVFLRSVFRELQDDIKILFDPDDEYSIIMPTLNTLRECIRALNEDIPEGAFKEPELIGWVYQYFQTEEKNRVFEEVRTKKKKIEGDDIIPATSLYTERYMVDYLIQNSLGAIWMEMYPDSKLCEKWPYFVKSQDLKPREPRPVKSLTFLDPASGSGHFHLVAFDLLAQMYEEETHLAAESKIPKEWVVPKEKIPTTILEYNLHGIDVDLRSVQLSYLVLYLRMREHQRSVGAPKLLPLKVNLVAADASLLNTPEFLSWCEERFKEEPYAFNIIKGIVGRLRNISEVGSLARPEEDLKELIHKEKERLFLAWKKEKTPKQIPLFREMLPPEQKELPFEKITDDQFWEGVLSRVTKGLDEYYREASERGDTRVQVLAHEASRGFKFLELCNRRYDVVATNPPYMGSKNMGKDLKDYVQRVYPEGKRDLYAAFILRNREWAVKHGIVAMVTQQSWMFLRSFAKTREQVLKENCIQTLAHLGPHAFAEILGEVVNAVLFTLHNIKPPIEHTLIAVRLISEDNKVRKEQFLRYSNLRELQNLIFKVRQSLLLEIPASPIVYWLRPKFFEILMSQHFLKDIAPVRKGLFTGDNQHFIRFFWEIADFNKRWIPHAKAGSYCKWAGLEKYVVDWQDNGKCIKEHPAQGLRNESFYFCKGLTYSLMAQGSMSCRMLDGKGIFDDASLSLFPNDEALRIKLLCILNTRPVSYLLRAISNDLKFRGGYVDRLPVPEEIPKNGFQFLELGIAAHKLKSKIVNRNFTERYFSLDLMCLAVGNTLRKKAETFLEKELLLSCLLHSIESVTETLAFELYKVFGEDRMAILSELGFPVGWSPLIARYDTNPEIEGENILPSFGVPKEVAEYLQKHERVKPSEENLTQVKSRLRSLFEAGPRVELEFVVEEEKNQTGSDEEEDTESLIGERIPIPTETFLEDLSVKMEIHPISIYCLLKEMREKEGLICWPECKRYTEDYFTVMILRLLGFRWPKQVEAGEPVPDWADKDGIIPITEHTEEKTLLERIRDRIGAEFGENKIGDIESDFADILYNAVSKEAEIRGKTPPKKKVTLPQWLEKEFFKRHASQFKKRPIAWHLTSSNGTFQVLIFCHKISLDIFKNLKNRHLAKVQSYYGSLLERARRGESVPGGLTAGKLSDIEFELEEFSDKLDKLIAMPYEPLIDDGVRVNIAPLQKLGLLASPVLAPKDVDRAIADRNRWREDDKEQVTLWRI